MVSFLVYFKLHGIKVTLNLLIYSIMLAFVTVTFIYVTVINLLMLLASNFIKILWIESM